jgi:hypothetical protein
MPGRLRIVLDFNTDNNGVGVDVERDGPRRALLDRFWVSGLDTALDEIRSRFMRGRYRDEWPKKDGE